MASRRLIKSWLISNSRYPYTTIESDSQIRFDVCLLVLLLVIHLLRELAKFVQVRKDFDVPSHFVL